MSTLRALGAVPILALGAIAWVAARPADPPHAPEPAAAEVPAPDARPVLPERALRVPLVRQKTNYSCGAAAALALLRYWYDAQYRDVDEHALYGALGTTPAAGTEPQPIARFFDAEPGLAAAYVQSEPGRPVELAEVERSIDAGEPVIVDIEAWQDAAARPQDRKPWATDWSDGHYVVAIAYDARRLYFMDPSTLGHYTYIDKPEFLERWHDVLGPDEVHVQHMTIFVHPIAPLGLPHADRPVPRELTPIE
jgi:predicted double-glycine peptidase